MVPDSCLKTMLRCFMQSGVCLLTFFLEVYIPEAKALSESRKREKVFLAQLIPLLAHSAIEGRCWERSLQECDALYCSSELRSRFQSRGTKGRWRHVQSHHTRICIWQKLKRFIESTLKCSCPVTPVYSMPGVLLHLRSADYGGIYGNTRLLT